MARATRVAAACLIVAATVVLASSDGARTAPQHRAFRVRAGPLSLRAVRAGRGDPVILLHGFGESLIAWRGVMDGLATHADVVALDLPGFGLSDKPATGYSNDDLAARVLEAMSALGISRATLVGHSMGGAVAIAAALAAPDRVRALVLIDPAVSAATWGLKPPDDSAPGTDWLRAAVTRYETLRPLFAAPHDPAWLAEDSAALAYSPAEDPAYTRSVNAVLREFDFDYLTPGRAARLTLPVLLIWGQFDGLVPVAVGRELVRGLGNASLSIVPRGLHRPHVERPDTVAAMIESFLGRLPPP